MQNFLCNKGTVINFDAVCAIACDVIGAIERLQELGMVHNNVTTSNIFIGHCLRVNKVSAFLWSTKLCWILGNIWLAVTKYRSRAKYFSIQPSTIINECILWFIFSFLLWEQSWVDYLECLRRMNQLHLQARELMSTVITATILSSSDSW